MVLMLITGLISLTSQAQITIMVVDFELRDVSPLPNALQEVERTALIDTVIKQTLAENGYTLIPAAKHLKKQLIKATAIYLTGHK